MKNIKLTVPAMQSTHCQNRVREALKKVDQIEIKSIQPGIVEFSLTEENTLKPVYLAIQSAGYEIMSFESTSELPKDDKILRFKSNINCAGCVSAVGKSLNQRLSNSDWKVDLGSSDKVLTVNSDSITEDEVTALINSSGFKISKI